MIIKLINWLFLHKIYLLVVVFCNVTSLKIPGKSIEKISNVPEYKTLYLNQFIDHFNHKDDRTFEQRYLLNDNWFNPKDGPIFFYAGNEADIVTFWNNTGFLFDIAPSFQALIVFGEHRYYGKSLPFGNLSFHENKIGFLSIEQAIADYAVLLHQLRSNLNLSASANPIIVFGGSYGGALAAYMRFKYPNLVQGAVASSAPIYLFGGLMSPKTTFFFEDLTNDFKKENGCEPLVRKGFAAMNESFQKGDFKTLSDKFKLCSPIHDESGYRHLILWLRNAFISMAMFNYPYDVTGIVGFLPAWPVRYACELIKNETSQGIDSLTVMKDVANITYNDTSQCFDIYQQFTECADPVNCGLGLGAKAWDYQACTELNTVFESNGITDMFPPISYNEKLRDAYCRKTWTVQPRDNWTSLEYWGDKIKSASNILFSNGLYDPLRQSVPTKSPSERLVMVSIKDGAHHLDLRSSNPMDPRSVIEAREIEKEQIRKWIKQAF